jgi:hypothetical protein
VESLTSVVMEIVGVTVAVIGECVRSDEGENDRELSAVGDKVTVPVKVELAEREVSDVGDSVIVPEIDEELLWDDVRLSLTSSVTVGVSENVSERDDEISSEGDCFVCEGESVSVGDCVTLPLPVNEGEFDRDSSFVSVATDTVTLRETLGDRVPRDRVPDFVKLIEILLDAEGVVLSELLRTLVGEGVTVSSSESESDGDALAIGDGVTPLGVSEMEFVRDRDFSSVAVVVYDGVALHDRDRVTSSDGVLLGEDSSEKEGEPEAVSEGDTEDDNDPEPVGVPDSVRVRDPRDSVTVPVTVSEGVLS